MINIVDKKDCCGCNACGDICPTGAISFEIDIEGFWYPKIEKEICTNCGLCNRVCPVININKLKKNDLQQSVCYAAEHKNIAVIFDSTSGGAFSAFAEIMYQENGYVGGAIYNKDFSVKHFISSNNEDLSILRSSKYLQSNLEGFFTQVKTLLELGEFVLVCGTPCQMSAMRAFLKKDFDNLIIVDFICRGVNSPKVWRKYLDSFEERYGSPVTYVKSKSKEYGWRNLTQKVILANGKEYYETKHTNRYLQGYLQSNAYCRPSCYDCQFKGFPRMSDITLADYWGIENIDKSMEKNLGTSLIMINSQKGLKYFERVKTNLQLVQTPFESILKGNKSLIQSLSMSGVNREQFFKDIDQMSFHKVAEKYKIGMKSNQQYIKSLIKLLYIIFKASKLHPVPLFQLLRFNKIKDIINGKFLLPYRYCILVINRRAIIKIRSTLKFGEKRIKGSKLESRLLVENGGTLEVHNEFKFFYGADVEVFKNAKLIIKGNGYSNINCTIICGNLIEIGDGVIMGRNVTIRDNNGDHYINTKNYQNSKPVIIGDKVWLCDNCTIMPGVKIGDGVIVGARAFVRDDVPPHSIVAGNPARVVSENILWKA